MPRPRYQLTEADVPIVHRWVQAKRHDPTWPQPEAARTARHQLARAQSTVEALHAWCARFLQASQWRQLQAVIRAARRDASQTRTVRLSTRAYTRLHDLATREQLTLSETIERYLAAAPPTPTRQATPAKTLQPPVTTTRVRKGAQTKAPTAPQKQGSADHRTGKVVAYVFGRRKDEVFLQLKALLEPLGMTRYHTDYWGAYQRNRTPEAYSPGKRNTQQSERKHLTLRTRLKRLTRKTICCSKSIEMHAIVLGLFVHRYEFGRPV